MKKQRALNFIKNNTGSVLLFIVLLVSVGWLPMHDETVSWKLDSVERIGAFTTTISGKPTLVKEPTRTSVLFDGKHDGLVVDSIPIADWQRFTIEVLFKPLPSISTAPRFIHFEDIAGNRGTFELRLTNNGEWYMDTFLKNGNDEVSNNRLTLIDSNQLHPIGKWYWAAMVYDGTKMYSYVNGKKELEGDVIMQPFTMGRFSMGVRLNKVNYFEGQISEIRFHPKALDSEALQKLPD